MPTGRRKDAEYSLICSACSPAPWRARTKPRGRSLAASFTSEAGPIPALQPVMIFPYLPRDVARIGLLLAGLTALSVPLAACGENEGPLPAQRIRSIVRGIPRPVVRTAVGDTVMLSDEVAVFYRNRAYEPVWVEGESVLQEADEALQVIAGAADDGLDPERYKYSAIVRLRQEFDETE